MNWYKKSNYITAQTGLTQEQMNDKLKRIIQNSSFFQKLFEEYNIPMEKINSDLTFLAKNLGKRYAQGNGKYIFINSKLFNDGDFFDEKLHYVAHELVHWLTRQKEKNFYMADPEEVESFSFGMAYEMLRGKNKDEIEEVFEPILRPHFKDEMNFEKLFKALLEKATFIAEKYGSKE